MGNETASRASLFRRLGAAVGSGTAGLLLLTACAAGEHAQTVEQTPSIDGVQAEAGDLAIRAAGIAAPESGASYAKGSTAQLRMVIVNRGAKADKLVSVASPVAGGSQFSAGSGASTAAGSGSPTDASPWASSSASGTDSETSACGSPSASAPSTPIELPSRGSVQIGIGEGGPSVTLTGLTTDLFPSQSVPVTLTFSSGASVTFTVAVQLTGEATTAPTVSVATQPGGE